MKLYFVLIIFLYSYFSFAQEGYTYFGADAGYERSGAMVYSANLEFSNLYYHSWELLFHGYDKNLKENESSNEFDERTWLGGIVYNRNFDRVKNFYYSFGIGALAGTNDNGFVFGPDFNLKFGVFIFDNYSFYIKLDNQYLFNAKYRLRNSLSGGIKIPL